MDNIPILKKCRYLAGYEKLAFLQQVKDQSLDSDTLLDIQHQTIFRVLYQYDKKKISYWMSEYSSSPSARRYLYEMAKSFLKSDLDSFSSIDIVFTKTDYDSVKKICRNEFAIILENMSSKNPSAISFANDFGFAYMPIQSEVKKSFEKMAYLTDLSMASVGAMMFYAFNVKNKDTLNFISSSMEVLSFTFLQYLKSNLVGFKQDFRNENITRELLKLPELLKTQEQIRLLINQFLMSHERGHLSSYKGNEYLLKIFDKLKISDNEFYETDFPSLYDLKSWDRVKAGDCRPRDICFLLGDYLANVAALETGDLAEPEVIVLRAFHWWLAKKPNPANRPRANINFLRYTEDIVHICAMLDEIEEIFSTCVNDPESLRSKVHDMECLSWEYLEEKGYLEQQN